MSRVSFNVPIQNKLLIFLGNQDSCKIACAHHHFVCQQTANILLLYCFLILLMSYFVYHQNVIIGTLLTWIICNNSPHIWLSF